MMWLRGYFVNEEVPPHTDGTTPLDAEWGKLRGTPVEVVWTPKESIDTGDLRLCDCDSWFLARHPLKTARHPLHPGHVVAVCRRMLELAD